MGSPLTGTMGFVITTNNGDGRQRVPGDGHPWQLGPVVGACITSDAVMLAIEMR